MMAMPIMAVGSVKSVVAKNNQTRERTIIYEGSSSPRELLEGIAIQAQAAVKGLEGNKQAESQETEELTEDQKRMTSVMREKEEETAVAVSDENQKLLHFCQRILATVKAIDRSLRDTKGDAFVDRLHTSLPSISSVAVPQYHVDAGTSDESLQKAYMDWATRARFEYCDLSLPLVEEGEEEESDSEANNSPHYKFFFDNEARMLTGSDIPKRQLAIAKEVRVLAYGVMWHHGTFD